MALTPIKAAAILCKKPSFARYLDCARRKKNGLTEEQMPDGTHNEEDAADFIRMACGISSRRELGEDRMAQMMLSRIQKDYHRWARATGAIQLDKER